ncbi:hypothetical protein Aduo_019107 [Ancylostoma duodenale]
MDQHTRGGPATWVCVLHPQGNGLLGMSGRIAVAFVAVAFVREAGVALDLAAMVLEVTSRSVMSIHVKPALENGLCGRRGAVVLETTRNPPYATIANAKVETLPGEAGATGRLVAKHVEKASGSE